MEKNYRLSVEPNWKLETIGFINNFYLNDKNEINDTITNCQQYSMSTEEMKNFLDKIMLYSEKVTPEIIYLLRNKYNLLEKYFVDINDKNYSFVKSIIYYNHSLLKENITDDEIDSIIQATLNIMNINYSVKDIDNNYDYSQLTSIISLLQGVDIDSTQKIHIINFYTDKYHLTRELIKLLIECCDICKKHFNIIKEEYNRIVTEIQGIDSLFDEIQRCANTAINIDKDVCANVYVSISLFNSLLLTYLDSNKEVYEESTNFIVIGMYLIRLDRLEKNNNYDDAKIVSALKTIADTTRFSILRLLIHNEMYLQEIADAVKLTPTTVSHHIDIMISCELLKLDVKLGKRKVYYSANKDKLRTLLSEQIIQLLKK